MSERGRGGVDATLLKEADNLRFQLAYLIEGAVVLGDCMDAPVRFRTDIEAVTLTSLHGFLRRYDEARKAVPDA